MQIQASGPEPKAVQTLTGPCTQCREIKEKRWEAVRQGNTHLAEATTVAMGQHLRAEHS
ncbi:fumarate hydratase class II [Streptomyces netropsis]|uniref:Fumarate hydratase class II n=1 Tax=Streptomyces netropsis TaxID=55404 RepID=A0A7W7L6F3_STRNE|nr:fumarate hydratase class II [Streptomyces netropsis]GGR03308.1 hypothetical protein GCM10010219_04210 [Streptomyces netropsis]